MEQFKSISSCDEKEFLRVIKTQTPKRIQEGSGLRRETAFLREAHEAALAKAQKEFAGDVERVQQENSAARAKARQESNAGLERAQQERTTP